MLLSTVGSPLLLLISSKLRRILIPVMLLVPLMSLAACVPFLVAGGTAGGYFVGQDERDVKTIANDATITASIKAKFLNNRNIKAFDINVDTRSGVVTLHGVVSTLALEDRVIALVREANGVKKIISKLQIESQLPENSQEVGESAS